ncbi:hypothetical protein BFP70_13200 [Thioclava sp. SK-1]|nr:hypothetical protein BFP70_13200 [Thioclava sp. SK-1]
MVPPDAKLITRKKDFLDRATARSSLKRSEMKQALDAILEELGEALSAEESLALPPLGKLRVGRREEKPDGELLIVRMRRKTPSANAPDAAADTPAEDEYDEN